MKSILIIGLGKFGHHLCSNLAELGNEIMAVDIKEEVLEDLLSVVTSAKIGDCTNEEVLKSLGVRNFDICFVCIGTNFQSSLEITSLIKELGAKYVISKANRDIHAKFLLRNGADEVIYPDEIPLMKEWAGRSIKDIDIRAKYHVNVLGTKTDGQLTLITEADYVLRRDEHLMVLGRNEDVDRILKRL